MASRPLYLLLLYLASASSTVDDVDINHLANVNTDFGLRMYKVIASNSATSTYGNIFFSPFSISTAFAMLHLGTNNNTRKELDDVMGFGNTLADDDNVHAVFEMLLESLLPQDDYYQLGIANRLFAAKDYEILESYVRNTQDYYNAPTERLDFINKGEQSRQYINEWVETKTHDKIKDFFKPGVLNAATVVVLVNAIYFKADWYKEFDKELTRKEMFTNYLGDAIEVDMMSMTSHFLYGESSDLHAKVLQIFYDGDKTSMVLMLPREGHTLADVINKLDNNKLKETLQSLRTNEVIVKLPRFEITQDINLKPVLQHMGIRDAFDSESADLSRINGKKNLVVSEAIHKAFIKVDETGTEAAAATGIGVVATSAGGRRELPEFIADQPFLFMIRHVETESTLFIGRMGDPTKSESSVEAVTGSTKAITSSCFVVWFAVLFLYILY